MTQIGGLVFLLSTFLSKKLNQQFRFKSSITFLALYSLITFLVVPFIAPFFGREKVQTSPNLKPATFMTIILNRNYVNAGLNRLLKQVSHEREVRFLDANFPFINGFPMLPHLSHSDGNKIDLSFIYQTEDGTPTNKVKSFSGYGIFEAPQNNEFDQISECKRLGYFQYDFSKYFTFGKKNSELEFSENETKALIDKITSSSLVEKVFIEPHLATRLNLKSEKVRFHGCQAVRHDDHIHLEMRKGNY